jgi:PQQ-dependent dehydrogenase (methanol/ethanol family)
MYRSVAKFAQAIGLLAMLFAMAAPVAFGGDTSEKRIRNCPDSDWCSYNRDDKGWRYSPLEQVNKGNVSKLRPAWIRQTSSETRGGILGTPLAMDGSLYFSASHSRVYKLNGATGETNWAVIPKLNDMVVKRQTHGPYSRGLCVGDGKVYMGTLDGRLLGIDDNTGKVVWETPLVDSVVQTIGFTGGCTYANGTVVIGQQAGEWPIQGRIFGVTGATGALKWTFFTVPGPQDDPEANKTWGGDSWKYGGGGGWQAGGFDAENQQVIWGTGNPNPLYDWGAENWKTDGARPGTNLYVTSVIALDINTGKLKWHYQEVPHDPYDYDSAVGEMVFIDKDGKKLVSHPSKDGFQYVYDRKTGALQNVFPRIESINFVKSINPKTGELIGQFWPHEGKEEYLCPFIAGGMSWNPGSYSPKTGMHYRIAQEWCMYLTVGRTQPITEPSAALIIGADFRAARPPDPADKSKEGKDPMHGVVTAFDPVTGKAGWKHRYEEVPHSALMSTAGGLLFMGNAMGWVEALDIDSGKTLWKYNNGSPHEGGIISYSAGGKQYIAVATGRASLVMDGHDDGWPDTFGKAKFTMQSGSIVTFALP